MVKESYSYEELRDHELWLLDNHADIRERMNLIQLMYEAVGLQVSVVAHGCYGARLTKYYAEMDKLPRDPWMFKRMVQKDWKDGTGTSLF